MNYALAGPEFKNYSSILLKYERDCQLLYVIKKTTCQQPFSTLLPEHVREHLLHLQGLPAEPLPAGMYPGVVVVTEELSPV